MIFLRGIPVATLHFDEMLMMEIMLTAIRGMSFQFEINAVVVKAIRYTNDLFVHLSHHLLWKSGSELCFASRVAF